LRHQTYYPILLGRKLSKIGLDKYKIDTFSSNYDEFVDEFGTDFGTVLSLMPMEPRLAPFTDAPLGADL
jgi:hypothetical protein